MQIVVDSLLAQYSRLGKGKTVVLLHGWADSSKSLFGLQKHLSKTYDVIALDLPGFGGSETPKETWNLDTYVAFVRAFLQKLDVGPVYAFVGHSNGGALAIRGLGDSTLAADKLVLLASAGIRGTQTGRNKALKILTKTGKFITMPVPPALKKKLRGKLYTAVGSDMLVAEHMQETFKRIVNDDVQADAAQISVPVLLMYGEEDTDTPSWYGRQYHELMTGSTLEILAGAGHFIHIDRPDAVCKAVTEFLD